MTFLLRIKALPDQFTEIARYEGRQQAGVLHLKLAEEDTTEALKTFLEDYRATGEIGAD